MFTLEEALKAIETKTEFRVNERPFGTVIDYNVALKDTFVGEDARQTLILKNLRGTCFDHDGNIISLAFDKFHNYGECDGWYDHQIDFTKPHTILEKLDGSMIRVIPTYLGGVLGDWSFGTHAGCTEVAQLAHDYLVSIDTKSVENYLTFIECCLSLGTTPIFELCSRANRVVLDYPETKLILTSIRGNSTGVYINYDAMVNLANRYSIPVVQKVVDGSSTLSEVASKVKTWIGAEGIVVAFDDGFRVKIKAEDYCLKHKALDGLKFEKDVLKIILTGGLDDVLPLVTDDIKDRLVNYRESVLTNLIGHQKAMEELFEALKVVTVKKEFAELVKSSPYRHGLFKMFDGKSYSLTDTAISNCGTIKDVENVRWLIGKSYLEF
jgi:RNA ligase